MSGGTPNAETTTATATPIQKPRVYQYPPRRLASSGSTSKITKGAVAPLFNNMDRLATDFRKSPTTFWRLLAILSTLLCLLSLTTHQTPSPWTTAATPLARTAHAANIPAAAPHSAQAAAAGGGGGGGGAQGAGVDEDDEDVNITRRKKAKRVAALQNDDFCRKLKANPVPNDRTCRRVGNNATCTNGEVRMFSQFSQDYYLYTHHFKHLRRPGTYMDIASNDAVGISNSYFFDRCLNWRGVCIEGNPKYFERLFRLRTCTLVPTCVGGVDGATVEFGLMGGAGGIMGATNKHMKVWKEERKEVTTIKERCTTVTKIAEREEMWRVDYLSLDVEGHELEVLKGIDWDRFIVNVLTIEVNRESAPAVEKAMLELGYKRHHAKLNPRNDLLGSDVVYLHSDVEWGNPQ